MADHRVQGFKVSTLWPDGPRNVERRSACDRRPTKSQDAHAQCALKIGPSIAIPGALPGPEHSVWAPLSSLSWSLKDVTAARAGRKQWQQAFANRTDWVILCERSQRHHTCSGPLPPGKDWCVLHRGGTQGEERRGRALREKGWWHRGSVRLAENSHTLVCRVPSNTGMRAHGRYGIEQAWFCRREKDDLSMHLEGLEGDYWLGTEAGSIGAYGFRGVVMATDGSATHGKMGAGYSELSRGLVGSEWQEASAEGGGSGKCLDCPEAAMSMGRGGELPWHLQKRLVDWELRMAIMWWGAASSIA